MKNKTKARALNIIEEYVDRISKLSFVKSIILVGSLSDDTYTEGKGSDIDIVNIINSNNYSEDRNILIKYIEEVENITNYDIPISKVVFSYNQLFHPYDYNFEIKNENKDLIELPIEILRIKYSGKVLYGEDIIDIIEFPTKQDVLKSKELNRELLKRLSIENPEWYESHLKMMENPTINIISQIVITNAMEDYFLITGKNCSSKNKILECIENDLPNYEKIEILKICYKYRINKQLTDEEELLLKKLYNKLYK